MFGSDGLLFGMVLLGVFVQLTSHWFPWSRIFGAEGLPRLAAYVIGVFGILAPVSIYGVANGGIVPLDVLWLVVVCCGVAVIFAYGVDLFFDQGDSEELVTALQRLLRRGANE